ncbi:MAG: hypothetical protein GF347_02395, partial [Candidatus Moranbacteria bacterium]|nr:hypothetical protein [Candidatus Moranbacteria bacterium]
MLKQIEKIIKKGVLSVLIVTGFFYWGGQSLAAETIKGGWEGQRIYQEEFLEVDKIDSKAGPGEYLDETEVSNEKLVLKKFSPLDLNPVAAFANHRMRGFDPVYPIYNLNCDNAGDIDVYGWNSLMAVDTMADGVFDMELGADNCAVRIWYDQTGTGYKVDFEESLDSPGSYAMGLRVYDGKLYCGVGDNGIIYEYDGSNWSQNVDLPVRRIREFAVYDNKLFAGTYISAKIYEYDGISWKESFDGAGSSIFTFTEYNGNLYAGGSGGIYEYDGANWQQFYTFAQADVRSLATYNGKMYAFTGGNAVVYEYDGSSWSQVFNAGETNFHRSVVYKNKLYAGSGNNGKIFVYDGGVWSLAFDTKESRLYGFEVYNDKLYIGSYPNGKIFVYDGYSLKEVFESDQNWIFNLRVFKNELFASTGSGGKILKAQFNNKNARQFNADNQPHLTWELEAGGMYKPTIDFDGTNDWFDLPQFPIGDKFSLSARFKSDDSGSQSVKGIITKGKITSPWDQLSFTYDHSGGGGDILYIDKTRLLVRSDSQGSEGRIYSSNTMTDNKYRLISGIRDLDNFKLFFGINLEAEQTKSGVGTNYDNFEAFDIGRWVGAKGYADMDMEGLIIDSKVYDPGNLSDLNAYFTYPKSEEILGPIQAGYQFQQFNGSVLNFDSDHSLKVQ